MEFTFFFSDQEWREIFVRQISFSKKTEAKPSNFFSQGEAVVAPLMVIGSEVVVKK